MINRLFLCGAALSLCGMIAYAAIPDEWTFEVEPAGTTLSGAVNSGTDGSTFEAGGDGLLETDGQGLLQSTPAGGSLWNGVELDADITDKSNLYLRYDLEYDFSSPAYTHGTSLGISFVDEDGGKLTGLMFAYEEQGPGTAPAGRTLHKVAGGFEEAGTLTAIAHVSNGTLRVWYNANQTNELVESMPSVQTNIGPMTIQALRVQAAGDLIPAGDSVAVETIRTADTWEDITAAGDVGPVLSENAVTLRVAPGETNSATIDLFNTGQHEISFAVSDDGRIPGRYFWKRKTTLRYPFGPASVYPDTVFDWPGDQSTPMEIGFDFPFFGNLYQQFSVDPFGKLTLLSDDNPDAAVVPFESSSPIDRSTIRYRKEADRLIVAWGNGSGQEFQVWLHADGTFEYLYELGTWDGWTGVIDDRGQRYNIDYTPGEVSRAESLLTKSEPFVTYQPDNGSISGAGSQSLTFTAAPDDQQVPGTNQFTARVEWAGQVDEVDVTVIVEPAVYRLDVAGTFAFDGPAGSISPDALMTITNSGNVSLPYTLYNSDLREAGYVEETESAYSWVSIPNIPQYELAESQLGTEPVSIGFPFVCFGRTWTQLIVEADGTLLFDNGDTIVPFSNRQHMGLNSRVRAFSSPDATRFVVTWDYLVQPEGSDSQRFQAVLHRDGRVQFNYRRMTEGWQNGTIALKPDDPNLLVNPGFEEASIDPWNSLSGASLSRADNARSGEGSARVDFPNQANSFMEQVVAIDAEKHAQYNVRYSVNADDYADPFEVRVFIQEQPGGEFFIFDFIPLAAGSNGWVDVSHSYTVSASSVTSVSFAVQGFPGGSPAVGGHFFIDDCALEPVGSVINPAAGSLVTDRNSSVEDVYETVSVTNDWIGGVIPVVSTTNVYVGKQTNYQPTITSRTLAFRPGETGLISYSPVAATLPAGATGQVILKADARTLEENDTLEATLLFSHPGGESSSDVTFTATAAAASSAAAPSAAAMPAAEQRAAMWGADHPVVSSLMNADGSRLLSWPAPADNLTRTYNILYTFDLTEKWKLLDTVTNATTYLDAIHHDEPVIYYKVTVQ